MKNKSIFVKGFVWLPVLLVILALAVVGGGAYTYYNAKQIAATQTSDQLASSTSQTTSTPVTQAAQVKSAPFSATPLSGSASLRVDFTADQYFADGTVDYGDGSSDSVLSVAEGSPKSDLYFSHTYTTPGVYTAKIKDSVLINGVTVNYANSVIIKVTASAQTISVPGMSQYTDKDFGFSFWYPNSWSVNTIGVTTANDDGTTLIKHLGVYPLNQPHSGVYVDEIFSPSMSMHFGNGNDGFETYFFNPPTHSWMLANTNAPNGAPDATTTISTFNNTMGGLHIFWGGGRFGSSNLVPLSAQHFLLVSTSNPGGNLSQSELVQTITATDLSVATPVSAAQQTAAIQAEKAAYAGL